MNPDISESEWRDIYIQLYAYAKKLLHLAHWFRRTVDGTYLKGKTPEDYVMEAVTRYLENPSKYDPTQRTLVGYLKYHIIRSLIYRDYNSKENRISEDGIGQLLSTQDDQVYGGQDIVTIGCELAEEDMYFERLIVHIRESLAQDPLALTIFDQICQGKARRVIIKDQGWTGSDYDNAIKRMRRVTKNVVDQHHLNQQQ